MFGDFAAVLVRLAEAEGANTELRSENARLRQTPQPPRSYAAVARSPTTPVVRESAKVEGKHVVLVFPRKDGRTSEDVRKHLKENLDPGKLKVGVAGVRKIRNNGVLIECTKRTDIAAIERAVASTPLLAEAVETKKPQKRKPRIAIFNVASEVKKEDIVESILAQNALDVDPSHLIPKFSFRGRGGDQHFVLEVEPAVFPTLMALGRVNVGWTRCRIREYLSVLRCFKCYEFGHTQRECKAEAQLCSECGDTHSFRVCKAASKLCRVCKCANVKFKLRLDTGHSAMSNDCPSHKRQIDLMRSRTDYGQ